MGDGIGVLDLDDAIGDGAEEGSDDTVRLVGAPDVAVADVEEDDRVQPRRHDRRRRWEELQHRHEIRARRPVRVFWRPAAHPRRLRVVI